MKRRRGLRVEAAIGLDRGDLGKARERLDRGAIGLDRERVDDPVGAIVDAETIELRANARL